MERLRLTNMHHMFTYITWHVIIVAKVIFKLPRHKSLDLIANFSFYSKSFKKNFFYEKHFTAIFASFWESARMILWDKGINNRFPSAVTSVQVGFLILPQQKKTKKPQTILYDLTHISWMRNWHSECMSSVFQLHSFCSSL